MLRRFPTKICHRLALALKFVHSPQMTQNWSTNNNELVDSTIMAMSWMQDCYGELLNSSGIKPPNKSKIPLESFPPVYQQHIVGIAEPIYLSLLDSPKMIKL